MEDSQVERSPVLPYVRMVVSLIEGVEFSCREVARLLCRRMRQHSIGAFRPDDYPLPADEVKNARFSPQGQPPPRYLPKHRKDGSRHEEQRLRALDPEVAAYVDFAIKTPGIQRHRFLRELFALSRKAPLAAFVAALARARRYRVVQMETLERIAWLCMSQEQDPLPDVEVDEGFRQRPAYQEGFLTDEPDLSLYEESPRDPQSGAPTANDETESEDHDG